MVCSVGRKVCDTLAAWLYVSCGTLRLDTGPSLSIVSSLFPEIPYGTSGVAGVADISRRHNTTSPGATTLLVEWSKRHH